MKYLLDTHAWLWGVLDGVELGRQARRAVASATERAKVGLAAISLKEEPPGSWRTSGSCSARLIVVSARLHGLTLITAADALREQAHVPMRW